jgi:hypothetical protein
MLTSLYPHQLIPRRLSSHRIRWKVCQRYRGAATFIPKIEPGLFRARIAMLLSTIGTGAAVYFLLPDTSRSASTVDDAPLSSMHFTRATLTSSKPSGPDTKQLVLTIPPHLLPPRDPSTATFAPIWAVLIKDDDIQVERPYTPLEGVDHQGRMRFWIKRYPKGEVSKWLHSKNVGDQVELRGPLNTWPWQEGVWDEVVMVCYACCMLHKMLLSPMNRYPEGLASRHSTNFSTQSSLVPLLPPSPKLASPSCTPPEHPPTFLHKLSSNPLHPSLRKTQNVSDYTYS